MTPSPSPSPSLADGDHKPLTVAVLGSIMLDLTLQTPRLPYSGENLYVHSAELSAGGKGSNAAVTLARHGVHTYLISNVGADVWGEAVREQLATAGVDTSLVGQTEEAATGTVVMLAEDNGQTCYLAYPGASRTVTPADIEERLGHLLPRLDALFFNFEAPEETLQRAMALARAAQLPIFVDAGPERAYGEHEWTQATIFSPNESETAALVGYPPADEESACEAARALLARGPEAVVLKLGPRGALWANPSGCQVVPAFAVDVVDPAGAGDAFSAGLCWATLAGHSLADGVRWANACGALVASRVGTMPAMPTRAEVEAFLARTDQRSPLS